MRRPLWPPPGTAPHGRSACVGDGEPLSVFFSVWVWRCQPHSGELVDAVLHFRCLRRCLWRLCLPALGLLTVVACSASSTCQTKAGGTVLARNDLRPLHRDDLCADFLDGGFRVVCWLGTPVELELALGRGHPGSAVRHGTLRPRLMWVPLSPCQDFRHRSLAGSGIRGLNGS